MPLWRRRRGCAGGCWSCMAAMTRSSRNRRCADLCVRCAAIRATIRASPTTRMVTICCCATSTARRSAPISPGGCGCRERRWPRAPTAAVWPPLARSQARHCCRDARMPSPELIRLLVLLAVVDGDYHFVDGRPLFGRAKTLRGVAGAIAASTAAAPLIGLSWRIGLLVGAAAMAGDLFSSFLKRRLGCAPSTPLIGLDQIPESLFPLLVCVVPLSLTAVDIILGVALFFVGDLLISRLLYAFDLRDRPY